MKISKTDSEKYTFIICNNTPKTTRQTAIMTIEDVLLEAIGMASIEKIIVNIDFMNKEKTIEIPNKAEYLK